MSKVRVYEVARELGLDSKDMIQKMAGMGIQVRNHMSVLEQAEVDRVKRALAKAQTPVVEERIRPTVVRRRAKKKSDDVAPAAEAPRAVPPIRRRGGATAQPAATPEPVTAPTPVEAKPTPVAAELAAEAPPAAPEVTAPGAEAPPAEAPAPVAESAPQPEEATEGTADAKAVEPEVAAEAEPVEEARARRTADLPPAPAEEPPAPAEAEGEIVESEDKPSGGDGSNDRFSHAPLPPGVKRRGNTHVGGVRKKLSDEERQRIVAEHAASRPAPRRREIRHRSSIGPQGRPGARPRKRTGTPGRKPRTTEITVPSAAKRKIRIEGQIQLQALAGRMSLKATDVLMKLMTMGMSGVHINSTLDADTATLLAEEFGYEIENVERTAEDLVTDARGDFENREDQQVHRAPVVTIMGHVDHGKTSLLDKIRSANVAAGEAGGITQHISSFRVDTDKGTVVFLDTPGHEAFTAMRARGAQSTDVVVLVCAADDGVMPQTREAVSHAKAAEVPIVVAVNKIDRAEANPEKVMQELSALELVPEDWGGDTIFVPTSAHTGEGIDALIDSVLLTAEVLELTANPDIPAEGIVLEAKLDRGRGVVANVLVQDGTLKAGDYVVAGAAQGRVRALTNDRGAKLKEAGPATPVELLGLDSLPAAGDRVYKVTNSKKAQEVAEKNRKATVKPIAIKPRGLEQLHAMMQSGEHHELRLVLKADVQGSIEALQKSLTDLSTEKVEVNVIHSGVGGITENDVMLASAADGLCIVLGFNVRPQGKASGMAKKNGVEVRTYNVIYEAIDDVKAAMAGLLAPKLVEKELGKAEVRQTFSIPKIGTIAGCMITDGKVLRNARARLVREGIVVWEGGLSSLRRFKDDAKEVAQGFECGIGLENYNDLKVGDIIEAYEIEEVAASLDE